MSLNEITADHQIIRLDGRVLEIFGTQSDFNLRIHVNTLFIEASEPGRDGTVKVRIRYKKENGEVNAGAGGTRVSMSQQEFEAFSAIVDEAIARRDAGPDSL